VRIAVLPLDSRPPNRQFPARLADCSGIEALLPPCETLGELSRGADRAALLRWLARHCGGSARCDALVLSLDALLYGGLVQSRSLAAEPDWGGLKAALEALNWKRLRGYAYITVPRLGISVDSAGTAARHELARAFHIADHAARSGLPGAERAREIAAELGNETVNALLALRGRNFSYAKRAMSLCAELGFAGFHIAVEDNAPQGPHIEESALLRSHGRRLSGAGARTRFSLFDGADECACLLLARAAADIQAAGRLPLRIALHPAAPGPDKYRGLYESHTLSEGLDFMLDFLSFEPRSEAGANWLICHGLQPQPDVFSADPARAFASPFLLPDRLKRFEPRSQRLYVSDLCACNGANPLLAARMLETAGPALCGLVGFNTNFNTLGVSAALISLYERGPRGTICDNALRRFLLERLADDVVYQSMARPRLIEHLRAEGLDPFNFAAANEAQLARATQLARDAWERWTAGDAGSPQGDGVRALLGAAGLRDADSVRYSYPWRRGFECEVEACSQPS
jgi:Protein of unknown function (DUF4127)